MDAPLTESAPNKRADAEARLANRMRKTLAIYGMVILSLLLTGCTKYDRLVTVADVREEDVIILRNTSNPEHVYGIDIRGSGNLDGEATISLILNGEPYKTEKLKGPVSFNWGGDWYSDTAEIRYQPNNVKSGKVAIEYKFSTL